MKLKTKKILHEAWNYCDEEDKSSEFMFTYMSDIANIEYDSAVNFVMKNGGKTRANFNFENGMITKDVHANWIKTIEENDTI